MMKLMVTSASLNIFGRPTQEQIDNERIATGSRWEISGILTSNGTDFMKEAGDEFFVLSRVEMESFLRKMVTE